MLYCSIDELLEGGLYSSEVTELCGAPGVGKTQVSCLICFCVQVLEVQLYFYNPFYALHTQCL